MPIFKEGNMENKGTSGGMGLLSVLGIIFIVLKLCHVIEWSWIWVLAPFWICFAIWIPILVILIILGKRGRL